MSFFDDSAGLTFPGDPFDLFAMDIDVSNLDGFVPDFMFATALYSATPGPSARIMELPDDLDMIPEMAMESQSGPRTMAVPVIQMQAPVDTTQHRPQKRSVDTSKNDKLHVKRRFASFSTSPANEQKQRPK
jgi:hypothetical protein